MLPVALRRRQREPPLLPGGQTVDRLLERGKDLLVPVEVRDRSAVIGRVDDVAVGE
jgi:hypothetical protein